MALEQHVLIIDDDPDILTAARLLLKRHFASVTLCGNPKEIPALLGKKTFDVILLDMNFGPGESTGEQGFLWLEQILNIDPDAVVIMITAHGGVNIAVEAMKQGATDFIAKPWQNQKVVATVNSAKKLRASRVELQQVSLSRQGLVSASQGTDQSSNPILGQSPGLNRVLEMLSRAAPTDANVLVLGENGTGKELIARELHRQSLRSDQVFMSIDVGALSDTLFESELFGHRKGAFTGANTDRVGRILAANGGTLFLDEVGNLPLHLQAKLLTVLAQRQVTPIGDNKAQAFDVRIVAATNLSKRQLTDETLFRQDLLFRLNTVELELPPLRERQDDILPIAEHYLKYYERKYHKAITGITPEAKQALIDYAWPGNIRALRHAVERAVILSGDGLLTASDFQINPTSNHNHNPIAPQDKLSVPFENTPVSSTPKSNSLDSLSIQNSASTLNQSTMQTSANTNQEQADLNLERMEKETISQALRIHKYNISHAAKALGLTRAALYRRMEKYGF